MTRTKNERRKGYTQNDFNILGDALMQASRAVMDCAQAVQNASNSLRIAAEMYHNIVEEAKRIEKERMAQIEPSTEQEEARIQSEVENEPHPEDEQNRDLNQV